ncbi:hypothetical protein K437DRAFT_147875 [Tilletiaria anomala UBC 951]|uniref:Palmitoyltransferase n=1 Tax=Tilletiaria anomala (strain ATCC 24038 / CBS 436.72 / UBC 951) TaxID=1037660 RepID=A0A066WP28_TILAU|nr:uncharacterized protein K437DRAFT_147875 [Tilletiaria anomala UBC 951]KDN52774.1 hypothetical protein K437DRAFT_147875 [Tilletiaria anomala UBC 951]
MSTQITADRGVAARSASASGGGSVTTAADQACKAASAPFTLTAAAGSQGDGSEAKDLRMDPSNSVPQANGSAGHQVFEKGQLSHPGQGTARQAENDHAVSYFERCSLRIKRCDDRVAAYNERSRDRRKYGTGKRTRVGMPDVASALDSSAMGPINMQAAASTHVQAQPQAHATGQEGRVIGTKGETFLQRHIVVVLVAVIYSWAYIVYVWRLCAPMLQHRKVALNSQGAGVLLLVIFNILFLMAIWSYIRVVLSQPGFARDCVQPSDPPAPYDGPRATTAIQEAPQSSGPQEPLSESIPIEHSALAPQPAPQSAHGARIAVANESEKDEERATESALAATIDSTGVAVVSADKEAPQVKYEVQNFGQNPTSTQAATVQSSIAASQPQQTTVLNNQNPAPQLLPEPVRIPPDIPPLHPSQRYCHQCRIIKPLRTHHCRKCGTCVLRMDHHCTWVAGCVGARNHKFFHNFLVWTTLLEVYILITLAYHFAQGMQRRDTWPIDGYMISLFPLIGWFVIFTGTLLGLHTYLFLTNQTTIEQLDKQRRDSREAIMLSMYFSPKGEGGAELARRKGARKASLWKFKEKQKIKRKWDEAWGTPSTQGNMWWLGGPGELALATAAAEGGSNTSETYLLTETTAKEMGVAGRGAWLTNFKEVMGTNLMQWLCECCSSQRRCMLERWGYNSDFASSLLATTKSRSDRRRTMDCGTR